MTGVDEQLLNQLSVNTIDLSELIGAFKKQTGAAYDGGVRELLVKYFRRAIGVETNLDYLNVYMRFLLEHLPSQSNQSMTDDNQEMVSFSGCFYLIFYFSLFRVYCIL